MIAVKQKVRTIWPKINDERARGASLVNKDSATDTSGGGGGLGMGISRLGNGGVRNMYLSKIEVANCCFTVSELGYKPEWAIIE